MRAAVLFGLLTLGTATAGAHGMRTAYLELAADGPDTFLATWKTTLHAAAVTPRFPEGCTPRTVDVRDGSNLHTVALRCSGGLEGRRLAVDGLGPVLTETVVRLVRADGSVLSRILTPEASEWIVPATSSWRAVLAQYVGLGVEHILAGADHLLFLLALVLYVRRPRDVFVTETAFTLSHSASFSATALGLVHVSAPAAEACIALSLVLVALDVANAGAAPAARWKGPAIALVFGLVHGLGFAGALAEVGLPDRAVALALVGFGLGVEIGQVAFLAVVLLAVAGVDRLRLVPRVALAGSYLVGITGSYWLVERLWVCFA